MFQAILEAIRKLVFWIEGMLKGLLGWLWSTLWNFLNGVLAGLDIPPLEIDWGILETANNYIAWADQIVPAYYGLGLVVTYWLFRAALIPVQWTLRHVPFVGGG